MKFVLKTIGVLVKTAAYMSVLFAGVFTFVHLHYAREKTEQALWILAFVGMVLTACAVIFLVDVYCFNEHQKRDWKLFIKPLLIFCCLPFAYAVAPLLAVAFVGYVIYSLLYVIVLLPQKKAKTKE